MTILSKFKPKFVQFDPTNDEHKIAYWMIIEKNKQHPNLRFVLEDTFRTIPEMMIAKMQDKPTTQWEYVKVEIKSKVSV